MKRKASLKLLSCLCGLLMAAGIVASAVSVNDYVSANATETTVTETDGGTRWYSTNGKGTLKTYNSPYGDYTENGYWADYTPAKGEESTDIMFSQSAHVSGIIQFKFESTGSARAVVQTFYNYGYKGYLDYAGHSFSIIYMVRPDGKTYATVSLTTDLEFDFENGYAYLAGTNQKTVALSDSVPYTPGSNYSADGIVVPNSPFENHYMDFRMTYNESRGMGLMLNSLGTLCIAYLGEESFKTAATKDLPPDSKYLETYNRLDSSVALQMSKGVCVDGGYSRQEIQWSFHGLEDQKPIVYYCRMTAAGTWGDDFYGKADNYPTTAEDRRYDPAQIQLTKTMEVGKTYTFEDLIRLTASLRFESASSTTVVLTGVNRAHAEFKFGEYTTYAEMKTAADSATVYKDYEDDTYATDSDWSFTPTANDAGKTFWIVSNGCKHENQLWPTGAASTRVFLFTVPTVSYENADGEEVKATVNTTDGKVTLGEPTAAAPAGMAFIGWKKVTEGIYADRLYSSNSVVEPTENETYVAQYANFTRLAGAEIRLVAGSTGIRWTATFDKAEFEALAGSALNYEYGAIITSEGSEKQVKVTGDKDKLIAGENEYTMQFALVNIFKENYTRKYYVAPYVTFTYFDGTTMTVTAGLDKNATHDYSTYAGIVNAVYGDVKTEKDEAYKYAVEVKGETVYTQLNPTLWESLTAIYEAVNAQ